MLPEFNVTMPGLPNTFVTEFINIANFDVIEMDPLKEFVGMDVPPVDPFNERLGVVGFEDTYFISNCGALFLVIITIIFLCLFVLIFKTKNLCGFKQKKNKIQKCLNLKATSLMGTMFWTMPIQVMLESYLILIFASLANILRDYRDTSGQIIELSLAWVFIVITMAFPLIAGYFMYSNFDTLGDR